jgi:hypothetical protein
MGRAHLFACSIALTMALCDGVFAADRVKFRTGTGLAAPADVPVMKREQIALCLRAERSANDEGRTLEGYRLDIEGNRRWLNEEKERLDRAAMTVNTLDAEGVAKHKAAIAYLDQRVRNHNVAVDDYNGRFAKLDRAVAQFRKTCTRPYLEDDYQATIAASKGDAP